MTRARFVGALIALVALSAGAVAAQAQSYPSHPITLLVGFPPGGPTDALARLMADGMGRVLSQTVVVETISGASGTIATGRVVHASADGYTIGIGNWTSHVGSPAVYALDYDVQKDLQPISLLAYSPLWILGKSALPPKTASELITWLKARKEQTTMGTVGTGSAAQLAAVSFSNAIGVKFQYVPYRGAGPAIQDLLGGQIDLSCLEASSTLPYVQAGKMKGYAMVSDERWPNSANTPTLSEAGAPGVSLPFWHGLWAPAGTPRDIIGRLDNAVVTTLADPVVQQRLRALGQVIFRRDQQNPAALAAYENAEIKKWWPIIKAAGIKAE
ncbi:MAG: tripartite tricarboxylate transporter substrate-binding protein [Xanthobacteraceae bacterium]